MKQSKFKYCKTADFRGPTIVKEGRNNKPQFIIGKGHGTALLHKLVTAEDRKSARDMAAISLQSYTDAIIY